MRRLSITLLSVALWASTAAAQVLTTGAVTANSSGSGCTAEPAACVSVVMGQATGATIDVSGTFVGTLTFEALVNQTWRTVVLTLTSDGTTATTTTTTGAFSFGNVGVLQLRVRATAWTSGTANIAITKGWAVARVLSPTVNTISVGPGATCVTPSINYTADTDTGIGYLGANNAALCANGATIADWSPTRMLFQQPIYAANGTISAPSLSFTNSTGTGFSLNQTTVDKINVSGPYSSSVPAFTFFIGGAAPTLGMASGAGLGWSSTTDSSATIDLNLARDAANTLAQRNGTNAQAFRIYNTYTDASNYERGQMFWTGNSLHIGTQNAGTGSVRDVRFDINGNAIWSINTSGHWLAQTDNTYDIGATGATRPRTGYFGTSVVSPIYQGSGTGTSVANVGANSCGTTAATIAGNQISGVITVGATAGTQCRVTFTTAAPTARECTVTDSTTTIATRATPVDTSNTDFFGAFVAGDKVSFVCMVR